MPRAAVLTLPNSISLARVARCALVAVALVLAPALAVAQGGVGGPAPEGRVDVVAARHTDVTAGGGLFWSPAQSVRLGGIVSGGRRWQGGAVGGDVAVGRAELVARFVLDRADATVARVYGSAGAGPLFVEHQRVTARVHIAAGIEAGGGARWRPAAEIGLGDGLRVGVILRRVPPPRF